ncbi:ATP-binding protein [Streptomyces sp. NPDC004838]
MSNCLAAHPPQPPGGRYSFEGPNEARTVRLARDWVACVLEALGRPQLVEAAKLCTSEAVTNTHVHTRTQVINVEVSVTAARVLVLVRDDEAGRPLPAKLPGVSMTRQSGRGLQMIAALAEGWGVVRETGCRKTVWFSLAESEVDRWVR